MIPNTGDILYDYIRWIIFRAYPKVIRMVHLVCPSKDVSLRAAWENHKSDA